MICTKRFIPKNKNDYIDFLNRILNKHLDAYREIINKELTNTGITVKIPTVKFTSQQSGSKAMVNIAYITNNVFLRSNKDYKIVLKMIINRIIGDISTYNKKNNVEYIHAYYEQVLDDNTYIIKLGVLYKDIKNLVDDESKSKRESCGIFSSVAFI